jgi:hypothetical protein
MTQPVVVMRGSAPRDYADTPAAVTVDGNKLPRVIPVDIFTATVTNPSPPQIALPTTASTADESRKFLENVLVWPGSPQAPGWINVHVNAKNDDPTKNGGKPWVTGWPFKTIDEVLNRVSWVKTTDIFFNVWVCMSQQSECTKNTNGKPKAVRKAANATQLKAIWIDCDVKPGDPKHYHTLTEAYDALEAFRIKVGLPAPSVVVNSGGGLHVYWISATPMSPNEWRPYAEGLKALLLTEGVKCDTGLTTDIARILRVPGTLNHKYNPPRPVELLHLGQAYDFPTALSILRSVASAKPATGASPAPARSVIEPGRETEFDNGADRAFAELTGADDLAAGIFRRSSHPLDPGPVFDKCGFMCRAKDTGGVDYGNTLWMYSVHCATFLENGSEIAHEISKGHATYTYDDTQAMYERKLADRVRGVGYPSCDTIEGAGCMSCGTCPHFSKGKSPLHLTGPITVTVNPTTVTPNTLWSSTGMNVIFANIPHRRTLYGFDLVRGEITVIGSPGGMGKSSPAIGMAISIAVGKELLGEKILGSNLKALLINAEDGTDEIRRRVWAACLAHGVGEHELQRLYVTGVDDPRIQGLSFLRTNERGYSEIDAAGFAQLRAALQSLLPDVIVLDPLVALCANGSMNDNPSMSLAMRALKRLAIEFDCAILIVAHTNKTGDPGTAGAISGAASIVNHSRRAIMPVTFTATEALKLGIVSEHWRYFKLVDAKSNLVPRGVDPPLYRLHSVELPNPEPPTYPHGDNVQAVVRVQLPIQGGGTGSSDEGKIRQAIIELVNGGKEIDGKWYPYSPSPAGADNIRALLPDAIAVARAATAAEQWSLGNLEAVVKAIIKDLQKEKVLVSRPIEELISDPGRFRRLRGLKVDHSRFSNGGSDAADIDAAA